MINDHIKHSRTLHWEMKTSNNATFKVIGSTAQKEILVRSYVERWPEISSLLVEHNMECL